VSVITAAVPLLFPGSPARGAPPRLIFKTFGSVELLFASSEQEFFATFTAGQGLILVHTKTSFSWDY
jgi:hypothetical protein